MTKKQKYAAVLEALAAAHPDARPELNFENPFQLLIATILSAQCTDVRVNIVTEKLFPLFRMRPHWRLLRRRNWRCTSRPAA